MPVWMPPILLLSLGLVVLLLGGELLVRGATGLAALLRISPLVIGLTVVAFGTSAPEFAVAIRAAFADSTQLAVGNAVGSNIFNVLFILGISALIAPLLVASQLIRRDVPLMIAASLLTWALALDGRLGRPDGILLFAGLLLYLMWLVRESRRESGLVQAEFAEEFAEPQPVSLPRAVVLRLAQLAGGLVTLAIGADWLVESAVTLARMAGISELLIGLTVIAIGTSLPEVAASLVASLRGQRDIAVGNIVGSNLFNLLGVLGLSAAVTPEGLPVASAALRQDMPVMIAVAIACLPIFFTGNLIARWEGALFFAYYWIYTGYLILSVTQPQMASTYGWALALFVLPLTGITLALCTLRAYRATP